VNLLERTQFFAERVTAIAGLRERAGKAGTIEQRAASLQAISSELSQLQGPIQIVEDRSIKIPDLDRKLLESLRARASSLKDRFATDKGSMLEPFPGEDFRYVFVTPLTQCSKKSRAALQSAWEDWATGSLPKIDDEVLAILSEIPALKSPVANIRNLRGQARELCSELPNSPDTVEALTRLAQEIASSWQSLAGDGIAPSVLTFLRAAGSPQGAAYELLTDDVFHWLSEHGLSQTLRIRLG
jgi:hypothetical protein